MVQYTLSGNDNPNTLRVPAGYTNYDWGIYAYGGNDVLIGANGDDELFGGSGNDTLVGGNGWNYLHGGTGYDTVSYSFYSTSSSLGIYVNLGSGEAWNRGAGPIVDDILYSIEGVVGSVRADYIIGNSARNFLEGNSGNDIIVGGGGNDEIWGDRGADYLVGSSGYDYFNFDSINDSNSYYGRDTIADFQLDFDMIDVSLIDARTGLSGNQAFTWRGYDSTFNGAQGELHYFQFSSSGTLKTVVEGDINGDRVADIQIYLNGDKDLIASDFIL